MAQASLAGMEEKREKRAEVLGMVDLVGGPRHVPRDARKGYSGYLGATQLGSQLLFVGFAEGAAVAPLPIGACQFGHPKRRQIDMGKNKVARLHAHLAQCGDELIECVMM